MIILALDAPDFRIAGDAIDRLNSAQQNQRASWAIFMFKALWNLTSRSFEPFALIFILSCAVPDFAHARDFDRTVPSGITVPMHQYKSWNKNCQNNGGVVRLLSKPQHGTAKPRVVDSHVGTSYFAMGGVTHCYGSPIKAFEVDYRSQPRFHGTDTFMIEETTGSGQRVVDTYTVNVQ